MSARESYSTTWGWSILLVLGLHLLSTGGTWWVTDHGEILAVAERFSTGGHLDLEDLGPEWKDWERIATARHSTATRFLPLSILSLLPFLALDHIFGWHEAATYRVAYLQGHVFVGLGLALAGRFIAHSSGSPSTAALAVLLTGLNWPVWMIARRIGPEPILFALLSMFVTGGTRSRILVLLLLPWVHATGPLLGLGALLWLGVNRNPRIGRPVAAWVVGVASVALLWNLPVHGSPFLGGYSTYSSDRPFALRNPLAGVLPLIATIVAWTFPLWFVTVRGGWRSISQSLALWLPIIGFLGLLSHPTLLENPEPERRLAPLVAAWAITVMPHIAAIDPNRAVGLAFLALSSGVIGLSRDFVAVVETPIGVFSGPHLLFLRLAFVEGRPLLAAVFVAALLTVVFVAGSRTLALILEPSCSNRDNSGTILSARNGGTPNV